MQAFVLIGGCHFEGGLKYDFDKMRETIVLSENPLDEMYKGKFRKIGQPAMATSPPPDSEFRGIPMAVIDGRTPDSQPPTDPILGDEVTRDYPEAEKSGLRVFRRDGRLQVCPSDNPQEAVHPPPGFATQKQVNECARKWASRGK